MLKGMIRALKRFYYRKTRITYRLKEYVHIDSSAVYGKNIKLLCWDSYGGTKFEKTPEIKIGEQVHITRDFTIQCANRVLIEKNVLIASDVFIIDYNHGKNPLTDHYLDNDLDISDGVIVEEGVWIGSNVSIMPGVTVGKKSIIGANSVVTRDIPSYSVAVGNPARVIKEFDFSINKWVEKK